MTYEAENLPTPDEADAMIAALDRLTEHKAEEAAATSEFEAYWAGSAWASVRRDYRAGRVITIKAGR